MKKTFMTAVAVVSLSVSSLFVSGVETEAATKGKYISATQAKEIALKKVDGKVIELEFENDKRYPHYEIEIRTANEEVELKVDAKTGYAKITDREAIKTNKNKQSKLITKERAIEIAKAKINNKGRVTDVELERDDGVRYYKIEIKHGKKEYEFEIHAVTGKILDFEVDHD